MNDRRFWASSGLSLQEALDAPDPMIASLRACAPFEVALRPQLRSLLHYHCGVRGSRRAS